MRLGFPQPLFLISTNPAYCSSRRVLTAFLPPAAEQSDHLADGVVQVDPPVLVRPAVLPGQLNCPQHTSFSVHFLFSAACELWRRSPGSILPGWTSGRTRRRRPHSVSSPYPGKSPLPAFRPAAKPPSGTTYSRPRKKPSAGRCRCPHRQGQCSCRPHSNSTPRRIRLAACFLCAGVMR